MGAVGCFLVDAGVLYAVFLVSDAESGRCAELCATVLAAMRNLCQHY